MLDFKLFARLLEMSAVISLVKKWSLDGNVLIFFPALVNPPVKQNQKTGKDIYSIKNVLG